MKFSQEQLHFAVNRANKEWNNALIDNESGEVIRTNGTLKHEDARKIMEDLTLVRQNDLTLLADLKAAGLTVPTSISDMLIGVETLNEFVEANQTMNPTAISNDQTDYELVYTPQPITHAGWSIPYRQKEFGYKNSDGLTASVRRVEEKIDSMIMRGNPNIVVKDPSGSTFEVFGYVTHPDRETFTITDWAAATPEAIRTQVLAMINQLIVNVRSIRPNSLMLYIPFEYESVMEDDYSTAKGDRTLRERLMAIKQIKDIKSSVDLGATEVAMVELDKRTVVYAEASGINTMPFDKSNPLDPSNFVTFAVGVPVGKPDRNGRLAFLHGSV